LLTELHNRHKGGRQREIGPGANTALFKRRLYPERYESGKKVKIAKIRGETSVQLPRKIISRLKIDISFIFSI